MGGIAVGAAVAGGAFLAGKAIKGIKDIWDGCSTSGYHPSASITAAHSKSNADKLAELKERDRHKTEQKEKQILDGINGSMDGLLKILENENKQIYGGKTLNINIKEIRSKYDALKKEVVGFLGNYMDDRLGLKDPELSKILEELDDKKRAKQFDAFYEKIQRQAEEKLKTKIETTVRSQEEIVRKEIQNRLAEVDKNMREVTKAYEDILRMKREQEDARIEEKQVLCCYQYELAGILLDQIGN